ncbi:MAG: hypothetical protein M3O32_03515 [Actinomycetota bacterium]|nr:hypothetical protein [Actinomycetota bacterium]
MEPIFESGWLYRGRRAQRWDVEDELAALVQLGHGTVDFTGAGTEPAVVLVKALAPAAENCRRYIVRIQAHTGLGVNARCFQKEQ